MSRLALVRTSLSAPVALWLLTTTVCLLVDAGLFRATLRAEDAVPESPATTVEETRRLPDGRSRPTEAELETHERTDFLPIRDRWRIGYTGRWYDPYNQNVLKGDYPLFGQDVFFSFTAVSDSLFEARNLPTPQGASRDRKSTRLNSSHT